MRVLGIDPGTHRMGYGVIDEGQKPEVLESGVIAPPSEQSLERRLKHLYSKLTELVLHWQPQEMAVEEPFAGDWRGALAIGQAQGVALLAAASAGLEAFRYSPAQIKHTVTDYGNASKEQVQHLVAAQLGLDPSALSADEADALAVALCHLRQRHVNRILTQQVRSR